jgi:conjugative transfer region protein TrbK
MEGKTLAHIGAIVFVSLAITATAVELIGQEDAPTQDQPATSAIAPFDPLRAELRRCQLLGEAGAGDPTCLRAWAENRRRFLAPGSRPMERLPEPGPTPDLDPPLPADLGNRPVGEPTAEQAEPGPPVKEAATRQCGALAVLGVLPNEC